MRVDYTNQGLVVRFDSCTSLRLLNLDRIDSLVVSDTSIRGLCRVECFPLK